MQNRLQLVIGIGKTGESIGRWLARHNQRFVFFDTRSEPPQKAAIEKLFPDAALYCGLLPESIWANIEKIYVSPGVDFRHPVMTQALKTKIPLSNDIDCLAAEIGDAQVVAITGTNGKSTVTELVGLMAKTDQHPVVVAGNIGLPVLDQLETAPSNALWVLELSSFQLDLSKHLKPSATTILNITPDHLDRHGTFANYIESKQKIYKQAQFAVYNRQDTNTYPPENVESTSFGLDKPNANQWGIDYLDDQPYLCYGAKKILSTSSLKLKGQHFWQNALAASALAHRMNISIEAITKVLSTYQGLPYRTQWVATINQVDYINDSKGTNVGATQSAIQGIGSTIPGKLILIAGGQGKGADFSLLQPCVKQYVKAAFIYGQDGPLLVEALKNHTQVTATSGLKESLRHAFEIAKPGDCVLFSPACASFDGFKDFNHRGEVFNELVEALK
ncbi:UDP-N-acetylmuramoyl-L-alanine--D-glutamate ligase [Legionella sp. W05-934-2]|jgi:UDP-N-acetylmuramoylalanine--D-glutamate ligase|uniref:UDP-N-acetylmuramoyl-L-alanine--D-glutamate ligase n=1 Tax=Legionella sp. W05-934-2 TaxID=1198649 RepID=UPI0034619613